jgi:hypothetical protein
MAFVQAMNSLPTRTYGVKGANVYTEAGVGDLRITLFTQLVRGANLFYDVLKRCLAKYPEDTCVLAFQTRDIRGGKGERDLGRSMLKQILTNRPDLAASLIPLLPEYGRWDDVWSLYGISNEVSAIVDSVVLEQFRLDQESERPSLLAKWLPRQHSADYKVKALATHFAALLFPLTPIANGQRDMRYRKTVAYLNKCLETTEIKMCGKRWATIEPAHVPGQLYSKNSVAFFNKVKVGRKIQTKGELPDRVECAENFKKYKESVKRGEVVMKGGDTTMPNEHIHKIINSQYDEDIDSVVQAQWEAIRTKTAEEGGLGKSLFLCDFSGSMAGEPLEVSLAMGILGSELADPAFRNCILTFDEEPKWHTFPDGYTLRRKIDSMYGKGTGLNTNFLAACALVLEKLVEHKVAQADAPTHLIVVTDMGFDKANNGGKWETQFQKVRGDFQAQGYEPPLIVCWNVSSAYTDAHAKAHEIGVVQLSGWSPSVLKAIQTGVTVKTPYDGLRVLLDDTRYDKVRAAVYPKREDLFSP